MRFNKKSKRLIQKLSCTDLLFCLSYSGIMSELLELNGSLDEISIHQSSFLEIKFLVFILQFFHLFAFILYLLTNTNEVLKFRNFRLAIVFIEVV